MSILDAITGVASAGTGIANTVLGFKNYNYMKDMQQEAWSREDTAVQRRMADLQAAGLSKTLAAGSGASTSGPIRLDAPQISEGIAESIPKAISQAAAVTQMMRQRKEIDQTAAQTKLLEKQADKAQAEIDFMRENNPQRVTAADLENQKNAGLVKNVIKNLELDVQRKGWEQTLQSANSRLKNAQVSDAEWKNTLQMLRQEREFNAFSVEKQNLIAKQVAIDRARIGVQDSQRNLEIYKDTGAPSNQALGQFFNLGSAGAQALKGLFNSFKGGRK